MGWLMAFNPFSLRTVIAMSLSFFLLFASLFGLSSTSLGHAFQPEIKGQAKRIFSECKYLLVMMVTGLLVVSLDVVIIYSRRMIRPTVLENARCQLRKGVSTERDTEGP